MLRINEEIGRKTGDGVVTGVAKFVKNNLAPNYTFVRFMGPKFAIVFNGAEGQGAYDFMLKTSNWKFTNQIVEQLWKRNYSRRRLCKNGDEQNEEG